MGMNINFSYGDESIYNLAFIKALLMKNRIEQLNITYKQKVELKKQIEKELKRLARI